MTGINLNCDVAPRLHYVIDPVWLATCAALSTLRNCHDKTENLAGFDVLMTNVGAEGQPSQGLSPPS